MNNPVFEIEKGVVMPRARGGGRPPVFPMGKMEVGESFLVPEEWLREHYTSPDSFGATVSYYGTRGGMKFAVRKVEGGRRVWRVK